MSLSELQASLAAKQNLNAQLQPKSIEIQVLRSQEKESTNKGNIPLVCATFQVDDEKQIDDMSLTELQASLAAKRILDAQLQTDSEQSPITRSRSKTEIFIEEGKASAAFPCWEYHPLG